MFLTTLKEEVAQARKQFKLHSLCLSMPTKDPLIRGGVSSLTNSRSHKVPNCKIVLRGSVNLKSYILLTYQQLIDSLF